MNFIILFKILNQIFIKRLSQDYSLKSFKHLLSIS